MRSELPRPAVDVQHAGQDLQQGRLPGAVRADERHALPALQLEVEIAAIDHGVVVALRDVRQGDHGTARSRRLGEPELHALRASLRLGDPLHALERLDAGLDLPRLGRLVAEALDERGGVGDLALLVLGGRLELRHPLGSLLDEVGVVADVLGGAAVVELDHAVGDLVDEVAVVADQHDRAGVLRQEALEPLHRCEVEVVGRLVQQQHVRVLEQQSRQRHPHHPASAEGADVALHVVIGEAQPGQDAPGLGLEAVAAHGLEPMLEPPVLVHQLGELVVVGRVLELQLDMAHAPLDAAHLAGAAEHLRQRAAATDLGDLLPQVADDGVPGPGDRPESASCSPVISSRSVVFPAPLGPTTATRRPAAICRPTSLNRCCAAWLFDTPANRHEAHGEPAMVPPGLGWARDGRRFGPLRRVRARPGGQRAPRRRAGRCTADTVGVRGLQCDRRARHLDAVRAEPCPGDAGADDERLARPAT